MAVAKQKSVERIEALLLTNSNSIKFDYADMAEAFPDVDPGLKPLGNLGVFTICPEEVHGCRHGASERSPLDRVLQHPDRQVRCRRAAGLQEQDQPNQGTR